MLYYRQKDFRMLNLISDPWIPVIRAGRAYVIRPDQIAEADVERLDWPRADLNCVFRSIRSPLTRHC